MQTKMVRYLAAGVLLRLLIQTHEHHFSTMMHHYHFNHRDEERQYDAPVARRLE